MFTLGVVATIISDIWSGAKFGRNLVASSAWRADAVGGDPAYTASDGVM